MGVKREIVLSDDKIFDVLKRMFRSAVYSGIAGIPILGPAWSQYRNELGSEEQKHVLMRIEKLPKTYYETLSKELQISIEQIMQSIKSLKLDNTIYDLKCELLGSKQILLASEKKIFEFYSGDKPSWGIIAANGDIRRDQEEDVEKILKESNGFRIICIVGEPGAGKSTFAWRIAYQLFQRGEVVLHLFDNAYPQFWYGVSALTEIIGHHFYVLIDDIFRYEEFLRALQNIDKDSLSATVIATSLINEYREARGVGEFLKKIELGLSVKEKTELLKRGSKSYEALSLNEKRIFDESESLLVLAMMLTKGKYFDEIIRGIIEELKKNDETLYQAYRYVCFSYSHGISIPEDLLTNLDPKFYKLIERAKGVFFEEFLPSYPTKLIRAGHQLIAQKALELYETKFGSVPCKIFLQEFLEAVDEKNSVHRRFIVYLVYSVLRDKNPEPKDIEYVLVQNIEKVSNLLSNASISELNVWRLIYKQLNLKEEVEKCSAEILSREPNTTLDCQLLVSELSNRGLKDKAFSVMGLWLKDYPDDRAIFTRYISLAKEKGDENLIKELMDKTTRWLKEHPEDKVIREALLTLVKERGSREEIKKAINDTVSWLKEHPEDNKVREAYLVLIREKGEQEQVKKAINDTVSWLKEHPEDNKTRSVYLTLVRDRGFLKLEDIEQALADAEEWMKKYGPHPLFIDYLALVKKVRKSEIGIVTNFELIKQLGYKFINSCKWEDNIIPINGFARWLSEETCFDESEQIYTNLLKIEIPNKKVKAGVYFGYGMLFLSQVMKLKLTDEERLERLKKAEEKFTEVLKNVKGNMARAYLAIALWEQARFEEAEKEFKHVEWWARNVPAVDYSPGKLFFETGKFYFEFNQHEEARFWYDKAAGEEPKNFANWWGLARAKMGLAIILEKKGKVEEARNLFSEALLELEKALEKAPKPLQLPASREIPNQISECKKHLSALWSNR